MGKRKFIPLQQRTDLFLYNHIQTRQVVYSRTPTLDNNRALEQLPFIGKKSKPRALRRDLWAPLAAVTFPSPAMATSTLHHLREFRLLHETQYPEKIKLETSYKKRRFMIMNQKANSIADLAQSIKIEIERAQSKGDPPLKDGQVKVWWHDIHDAEYAKEWPKIVQHSLQGPPERYASPSVETLKRRDAEAAAAALRGSAQEDGTPEASENIASEEASKPDETTPKGLASLTERARALWKGTKADKDKT